MTLKNGICPKKNKYCKQQSITWAKDDFICTGMTSKPQKYKKDHFKLCLKGAYINDFSVEMTWEELLIICRALLNALSI